MGTTKTITARMKVTVMTKATVKISILILKVALMKMEINYVLDIIKELSCLNMDC